MHGIKIQTDLILVSKIWLFNINLGFPVQFILIQLSQRYKVPYCVILRLFMTMDWTFSKVS